MTVAESREAEESTLHPGSGWLLVAAALGGAGVFAALAMPYDYPEGYCTACAEPDGTWANVAVPVFAVLAVLASGTGLFRARSFTGTESRVSAYWTQLVLGIGGTLAGLLAVGMTR